MPLPLLLLPILQPFTATHTTNNTLANPCAVVMDYSTQHETKEEGYYREKAKKTAVHYLKQDKQDRTGREDGQVSQTSPEEIDDVGQI